MKLDRVFVMDVAGATKIRSGMDIAFASFPVEAGNILMRIYFSNRLMPEIADLFQAKEIVEECVKLSGATLHEINFHFNQVNNNISYIEIKYFSDMSHEKFQLYFGEIVSKQLQW